MSDKPDDVIADLVSRIGVHLSPDPLDVAAADALWCLDHNLGTTAWVLARYIAVVAPDDAAAISLREAINAFSSRPLTLEQQAWFKRIDGLQFRHRTDELQRLLRERTAAYLKLPAEPVDEVDALRHGPR